MMARVKIFSTGTCPLCERAKKLLSKWKIPYQEVRIDQDREGLMEMSKKTDGARSVPQIFIDDKWIGGFTELTELHMETGLEGLVEK